MRSFTKSCVTEELSEKKRKKIFLVLKVASADWSLGSNGKRKAPRGLNRVVK